MFDDFTHKKRETATFVWLATKAGITTGQMCPLKQLCAPCHGGRGGKNNGPGSQQRQVSTTTGRIRSDKWHIKLQKSRPLKLETPRLYCVSCCTFQSCCSIMHLSPWLTSWQVVRQSDGQVSNHQEQVRGQKNYDDVLRHFSSFPTTIVFWSHNLIGKNMYVIYWKAFHGPDFMILTELLDIIYQL